MGCNQSTDSTKKPSGAGRRTSNPMSKQEIHKRIDSIEKTCTANFGGVSVRYAYLSQRGYYPDGKFVCKYMILLQYYSVGMHIIICNI